MDKLKNKYDLILGFVTLVVSFSAFEAKLSNIYLQLGYTTITAAQYFLYVVVGFGFCLYWFLLENVFRDTKIGTWKIWNWVIRVSYALFAIFLVTPLLLALNILIYKLVNLISGLDEKTKKSFVFVLNILATGVASLVGTLAAKYSWERIKFKKRVESQQEEIIELENAQKLFDENFYSQSVLESFKVLESHLYNELTNRDVRVRRYKFNEILKQALNNNIISDNDIPWINDIRGMRNVAAHSDVAYTKAQAQQALEFVRQFLKRSKGDNI